VRRRTRLAPLLVAAAVSLVLPLLPVTPVTVPVAAAKAAAPDTFRVKPGLVFNDPSGKSADKRRIVTRVEQAIDHSPKGSTIRIAQYLNDLDSSTDKLIKAYKRGVKVQLLIDDNPISKQTQRLRDTIGTNKKKASFVTRCTNSCMSSSLSVMHAKFFLFSQSGVSKNVSMISSANLYTGNSAGSWNNMHILVGDTTMYASLNKYFVDMLPDKDQPNYYRTTSDGRYKAYMFPRAARPGTSDVIMLDVLNHVRCSGAAAGYGDHGKTLVRVEQWGWSSARKDIAQRLWTLADQGCGVQIIANKFNTNPRVQQILLRPTRHGQIRFYDAGYDIDHDGKREYMHHKVVAISGVWFGRKNAKVVYTGSANFSGPATLRNNELVLRVLDDKTYDAYMHNFAYIRNDWTHRITAPAPISPLRDAKLDQRIDAAPDTEE